MPDRIRNPDKLPQRRALGAVPNAPDFFAPFWNVTFYNRAVENDKDNEPINDTTLSLASDGDTSILYLPGRKLGNMRNFASSMTIVTKASDASTVQLSFNPPWEDALRIIDNRLLQKDSLIKVAWGWLDQSGEKTITAEGIYQIKPPQVSFGEEITIEINGLDLFTEVSQTRTTRRVYDRTQTAFDQDIKILEFIAKKGGLVFNSDQVPANAKLRAMRPLITWEGTEVPQKDPDKLEQNTTDWQFFHTICNANDAGYYVSGSTVYVYDLKDVSQGKWDYRFMWYRQPEDPRDIVMFEFSTNPHPWWFNRIDSLNAKIVAVNPDTGELLEKPYDVQKDPEQKHLGKRSGAGAAQQTDKPTNVGKSEVKPRPRFGNQEFGKFFTMPVGAHGGEKRAEQAMIDAGRRYANQAATLSAPGMPNIRPQTLVDVLGVGEIFGGTYRVHQVTHNLSSDGYDMELELKRDTVTGAAGQGGPGTPPVGKTNDAKKSAGKQRLFGQQET